MQFDNRQNTVSNQSTMPRREAKLIFNPGTREEREYPFVDEIEIGRSHENAPTAANRIALTDPRVSSRHCIVTQTPDGRFLVRDLSRNGTRVHGKRLIPNLEFEIQPTQTITVEGFSLTLWAGNLEESLLPSKDGSTVQSSGLVFVTLLVGDIRGYTTLNQQEDSTKISRAVRGVFSELEDLIAEHGGSIKEYQGDALFAFWEEAPKHSGDHTIQAMDAAIALDRRVGELARDPSVWPFSRFPLRMDFALGTGGVVISSFGKNRPSGLSMVGDAVNLAFRIEKLATDQTGPILVCTNSRNLGADLFEFEDLGEVNVRGRAGKERIFALRGRKNAHQKTGQSSENSSHRA